MVKTPGSERKQQQATSAGRPQPRPELIELAAAGEDRRRRSHRDGGARRRPYRESSAVARLVFSRAVASRSEPVGAMCPLTNLTTHRQVAPYGANLLAVHADSGAKVGGHPDPF